MNTSSALCVIALLFAFLGTAFASCQNDNSLAVKTKQGTLRGKHWRSRKGRIFSGFTGIPYAKPPIGDLRFKQPVPKDSWKGILNATKSHNVCPQISIYKPGFPILGDEDCLYLNVYTPQLSTCRNELLPVMFYVHGGSFVMGSAKPEWLGPELLLEKDIVLVTLNYRLGALGFLSTGDDIVPGNNGLKDQNLALKWVRRNIANFGGDPNKITIFGNSAGAAGAHLHMFSPLSKDLIRGAIIQSGSAASSYAVSSNEQALSNTKRLGKYLNCSVVSTSELIECLRRVDVKEIIAKEAKFSSWDNETTIPFRPVVEHATNNAFLIESPIETLKSQRVADIPMIIGVVAQEAAYKSADLNSRHLLKLLDKLFNLIVPPSFGINKDREASSKAIRKFYFGDKKIDNSTTSGVTDMYSDGWWLLNNDITIRLHKQYSNQPIYQYLFDYRGSTSYSTLFGDANHDYGVSHTDELLYLFTLGMTFPNYKPTKSDIKMSEVLATLWTNFAKYGTPNPKPVKSSSVTAWNPVESDALEYYHIKNFTNLKMQDHLYSDRISFWRSLPVEKIEDVEVNIS